MNALSEFVNTETIGHRYVIQYFHLKGLSPTNTETELDSTLGESAPSFTTIKYWVKKFKRSRTSCQDEHRSGRPNEVTTTEMVKKIHKMVLDDRRLKVHKTSHINSKFGHEKAVRKMGAVFTHSGTETASLRCFNQVFGDVSH